MKNLNIGKGIKTAGIIAGSGFLIYLAIKDGCNNLNTKRTRSIEYTDKIGANLDTTITSFDRPHQDRNDRVVADGRTILRDIKEPIKVEKINDKTHKDSL